MNPLFTIGHSDHSVLRFLSLLSTHKVEALADVRSHPYSKRLPQFSRENLESAVESAGVRYVFLGRELGARREETECYVEGRARYDLIAQTPAFHEGLRRVRTGLERFRIALMCSEYDPITCHRMVLVCHALRGTVPDMRHILRDGSSETNAEAERRMLQEMGLEGGAALPNIVEQAYRRRGERIAYTEEQNATEAPSGPETTELNLL
jgi:uncharacterized protein (DUF488 family)